MDYLDAIARAEVPETVTNFPRKSPTVAAWAAETPPRRSDCNMSEYLDSARINPYTRSNPQTEYSDENKVPAPTSSNVGNLDPRAQKIRPQNERAV